MGKKTNFSTWRFRYHLVFKCLPERVFLTPRMISEEGMGFVFGKWSSHQNELCVEVIVNEMERLHTCVCVCVRACARTVSVLPMWCSSVDSKLPTYRFSLKVYGAVINPTHVEPKLCSVLVFFVFCTVRYSRFSPQLTYRPHLTQRIYLNFIMPVSSVFLTQITRVNTSLSAMLIISVFSRCLNNLGK